MSEYYSVDEDPQPDNGDATLMQDGEEGADDATLMQDNKPPTAPTTNPSRP